MEINTKEIAEKWKAELKNEVELFKNNPPSLAIIVAKGYSEASYRYINNKLKVAKEIGIKTVLFELEWKDRSTSCLEFELINLIKTLNNDDTINGIIVQLPFANMREDIISNLIHFKKDVDGFSNIQKTKLVNNSKTALIPCTALGVMKILESQYATLEGKTIAIINRSNLIGKPLFNLSLHRNMTPIIIHTKTTYNTRDFALNNADIIVSGCGKRRIFNSSNTGRNTETIIDCSMTIQDGFKGVGDFYKESILEDYPNISIASGYGHTGLTTVVALMHNVIKAYKIQNEIN